MTAVIDPSRSKIVMVIGKYFDDYAQIDKNIMLARNLSRMVFNAPGGGLGAFTPHMNTAHFEVLTIVDEPTFQEFDKLMIKRAGDAGIVVPNWRDDSPGSLREIELCNKLDLPVFEEMESLLALRDGQAANAFMLHTEKHHARDENRDIVCGITILKSRTASPLTIQDLLDYKVPS